MSFIEELKQRYSKKSLKDLIEEDSNSNNFNYESALLESLSALGFLKRSLPLEDVNLFSALKKTIGIYSKYKPAICYTALKMGKFSDRYVIPSDRYVIKIEPDIEHSFEGDIYNVNEFLLFTRIQSPLSLRRYTILQQWVSTARHLMNPEKYFLVRKEEVEEGGVKRLLNVLYLRTTYLGNSIGVYFSKSWDLNDLNYLPKEDIRWFSNYLTAMLKYELGEILSSYGSAVPGESSFSLNGSELKAEAQVELTNLETELIQSSQKVLPFFG